MMLSLQSTNLAEKSNNTTPLLTFKSNSVGRVSIHYDITIGVDVTNRFSKIQEKH